MFCLIIGFLIKHEVCLIKKKRAENKQRDISETVQSFNETLLMVKELNNNLRAIQNQNQMKLYHERRKYS